MRRIIYAGSVGTPAALGKRSAGGSISGTGEGVYSIAVNDDLTLERLSTIPVDNAGIICASPDGRHLYGANETRDFSGLNGSGGGITAFEIDATTGELRILNDSLSYGARTSYVTVAESGRYLLASNHGSHTTVTCHYVQDSRGEWRLERGFDDSSIALFHLEEDGKIGALADLKVFQGHGYWCHGGGQSTSHIHSVRMHSDLVFACNRGADTIEVMRLDETQGTLTVLGSHHVRRGYAPRHLDFHPNADILYVTNENYPSVSVYRFMPETGALRELQTVASMPSEYYLTRPLPTFIRNEAEPGETNTSAMADREASMPSDIHVSHDGRFVYSSNRSFEGVGNLAVYEVQPDYTLRLTGNIGLNGRDPRGFAISENDRYLVVGLLDQNTVEVIRLDVETGLAEETVSTVGIASPASFVLPSHCDLQV